MSNHNPGDEGELDKLADHMEGHRSLEDAGRVAEHLVPLGGTMVHQMNQIAADLAVEEKLDKQMLETIDKAFHEQTPAELPGISIDAIKKVDPQFDEMNFRTIARETFYKVREARTFEDPQEGAALLSPAMEQDLSNAIAGDVASHRHHLLPFLTVTEAVISGADVVDGREHIDVLFDISSAEVERDDATSAAVSGDTTIHNWQETWRFERDPSVDTSAGDEQHILSRSDTDNWMVAHRGWIVSSIQRLNPLDAALQTPSA